MAKKKLKKAVEKNKWLLLLPFKRPMVIALKAKKKNVKFTTPIKDVALMFNDTFVKKHFEDTYEGNFEDNYGYHYSGKVSHFVLSAAAISAIITGIVAWFKDKKAQKDAGVELTDAEMKAIDIGEKVEENVKDIEAEKTSEAIGESVQKFLPLIGIGLVAFFLLRKK